MKNKVVQLFKTFAITLFVAFVATNKENFVYNFIEKLGYESDLLKKTVLSALIALFIGLMLEISSYLVGKIRTNFKRMDVTVNTKLNGNKRTTMKFSPTNYEYFSKNVEIEIILKPQGWIPTLLIKKLGISFDIYFNPELLDISFRDKWDNNLDGIYKLYERRISINLLEKVNIKGNSFKERPYKLTEQFNVKPIRVKNDETSLDLVIMSSKFVKIVRLISKCLIKVNFEPLIVSCKGEE
ncbi:hypothetical protein Pryu01_02476 [Paraliobacillus ryukyuensis]|uniref:Uncharacterized protein n=1 Tax=Paraliobacillus ryukyuensis TaxID=200904 RepID=A0A366DTX1_9BACI|nr:hypothetical protein [Paraliobacillus ryukyuensis]RBO93537.1 hypothetical protein DES48_11147 [Paraliobacillus ryukyuensis]